MREKYYSLAWYILIGVVFIVSKSITSIASTRERTRAKHVSRDVKRSSFEVFPPICEV